MSDIRELEKAIERLKRDIHTLLWLTWLVAVIVAGSLLILALSLLWLGD